MSFFITTNYYSKIEMKLLTFFLYCSTVCCQDVLYFCLVLQRRVYFYSAVCSVTIITVVSTLWQILFLWLYLSKNHFPKLQGKQCVFYVRILAYLLLSDQCQIVSRIILQAVTNYQVFLGYSQLVLCLFSTFVFSSSSFDLCNLFICQVTKPDN